MTGVAIAQEPQNPDVQHLHFRYGPLTVTPGQNLILAGPNLQKPTQDGYVTRFKPDLQRADGSVPNVDVLHLHHGVWLNASRSDATAPNLPERIFASGEEKTIFRLPAGYGYPVRASDVWIMNYMIHDLTASPETVYITYDLDFVPAASALGKTMKPVRPIWMDVENGSSYPVFDVHRGAGTDGQFTFPDQATNPYGKAPARNEWTVDRPGTLVATAGHVHPGGLHTDLDLIRPGAHVASSPTTSATCPPARRRVRHRKRGRGRARRHHSRGVRSRGSGRRGRHRRTVARSCPQVVGSGPIPGAVPDSVRLFRSNAHYFDPHGPVSWDLAMGATSQTSWKAALKPGDKLRVSATYDTSRASWYESMGIMVAYMADDSSGVDPFRAALDQSDTPTHGQLSENVHYGGTRTGLPDPASLSAGQAPANTINIADFAYIPGDQSLSGALNSPPAVREGQSLNFVNQDAYSQILHSVTACRQPCNLSTGASYPLADGPVDFDSGNLGFGPPGFTAAANRDSWQTPPNLQPGTYTFFCRIHPFMHGAFRVIR